MCTAGAQGATVTTPVCELSSVNGTFFQNVEMTVFVVVVQPCRNTDVDFHIGIFTN